MTGSEISLSVESPDAIDAEPTRGHIDSNSAFTEDFDSATSDGLDALVDV